jgi:hypothetical protein
VAKGIRFYLASASDYPGCGYPALHSERSALVELLRAERAKLEPELATAIILPEPDESEKTRPPLANAFFSACQMPHLVSAYYKHVDAQMKWLEGTRQEGGRQS